MWLVSRAKKQKKKTPPILLLPRTDLALIGVQVAGGRSCNKVGFVGACQVSGSQGGRKTNDGDGVKRKENTKEWLKRELEPRYQ